MRVAIQGERGSNSHRAVLALLGTGMSENDGATPEVVPCSVSAEVLAAVVEGTADCAVLPIENSLHGSVAEHYDLLLAHPVRIERETLLHISHNLIAAPGVALTDIRYVLSHPVALSQCRASLQALAVRHGIQAVPFYDTAGSVKHLMAKGLCDTAGIAPVLAASEYGAHVLLASLEDHAQNFTRFHLIRALSDQHEHLPAPINKMSLGFAVEHRPGSLAAALSALAEAGVDLTQIESRPVPGRPWEYIFYVDLRISDDSMASRALTALAPHCSLVKELGRYAAAAAL